MKSSSCGSLKCPQAWLVPYRETERETNLEELNDEYKIAMRVGHHIVYLCADFFSIRRKASHEYLQAAKIESIFNAEKNAYGVPVRIRPKGNASNQIYSLSPDTVKAAIAHRELVKNTYTLENRTEHFSLRGIGWLYVVQGMTIVAQPLASSVTGLNTILFRPVEDVACDPSMLLIWVRVAGPEIFSGSAMPDAEHECRWYFDFEPSVGGEYRFDAKVLNWNGAADIHPELCQPNYTNYTIDAHLKHEGIVGFKFYNPARSCCEICSRTPGCVQWWFRGGHANTNKVCEVFFDDENSSFYPTSCCEICSRTPGCVQWWFRGGHVENNKVCEVFFDDENSSFYPTSPKTAQNRRQLQWYKDKPAHGVPRGEPTAYYMGCGWSYYLAYDFPCVDGNDDNIYGSGTILDVSIDSKPEPSRRCGKKDELMGDTLQGRWVRAPFPNQTTNDCPNIMESDLNFSSHSNIMKYDGKNPSCWHRDDLSNVGKKCPEQGCRKFTPSAWKSYLQDETHWYGTWKPFDCSYEENDDVAVQKCVNELKIESITAQGASIANIIKDYLNQRLVGINLVEPSEVSVQVIIDTLKMPHQVWNLPEDKFKDEVYLKPNATKNVHRYFVTGFYFSSEREHNVIAARSEKFSRIAEEILLSKGWKSLNAYDMTAAFTFDTAEQKDGVHIVGPPMKMILVKFFHHLCYQHDGRIHVS
eukprot:CAMPEP_0194396002 /NCGR_PEP_ID=MMETSP0174-20130528/124740_1 /TAXON_ID=216777 /ORGANISM="Proboscia alata, Strain PI-D3" /LENGTH=697 /DNA_ID=CAMNT_0039192007 /DNA_START=97 /DNA_END=2191 /DNA_ORIENTATION=+